MIRDYNGQVVTKLGLTPIPIGRPPFPLPRNQNVAVYFTVQAGGAFVEVGGARYVPGGDATPIYTNRERAPAGHRFNFWSYDPEGQGWHINGTGRVSANRKSIVPDSGTVVQRFTGAMVVGPDPGNGPGELSHDSRRFSRVRMLSQSNLGVSPTYMTRFLYREVTL